MSTAEDAVIALTPGARRLIEAGLSYGTAAGEAAPGVYHWLIALLEQHGAMAEAMVRDLCAHPLLENLRNLTTEGQFGDPLPPERLATRALELAKARGREIASERDVATVLLSTAGYALDAEVCGRVDSPAPHHAATPPPDPEKAPAAPANTGAGQSVWQPRSLRPTPALERYGRDMTREALAGKLSAFVGREAEIGLVIETLCRRTKRNPVLVGPAGVGKTAIVEGLAQRIVKGEVPQLLRGARLLAIQPSTLIAGAAYGDLEKRIEAILEEAAQEGVLLFIDEVHAIVGAGGRPGVGDIASMLKPALARGEIACIASTTDDEYRRFIEPDDALERRFQPLRVGELSAEQTLLILDSLRDELAEIRGVTVAPNVLREILAYAERFLRNRHFPDKAVDLLEQCVAHSIAEGKPTVESEDARQVIERLVGMPLSLEKRIDGLQQRLEQDALLSHEESTALLHRLSVTLSGFDLRPGRPNAVLLMLGNASERGEYLAGVLGETLFGSRERTVSIDFGRFTEAHHVSMLVGSPPGYVGYSENLPIHQVAQMPWCVLVCENLHACHPVVRDALRQALASGSITDSTGRRIYLSDTVTVVTAREQAGGTRAMGIRRRQESAAEEARMAAERMLGRDFVEECDVVCTSAERTGRPLHNNVHESLLRELTERYGKAGIDLHWDDELLGWLASHEEENPYLRECERLIDNYLSPLLLPYLRQPNPHDSRRLVIRVHDGSLQVAEEEAPDTDAARRYEGDAHLPAGTIDDIAARPAGDSVAERRE